MKWKNAHNVFLRSSILCHHGQARIFFSILTTCSSHNRLLNKGLWPAECGFVNGSFCTISFILLPYTLNSFGGLSNNKSKYCGINVQVCQKSSHQFKLRFNSRINSAIFFDIFYWLFDIKIKKNRVLNCSNSLTRKITNWTFVRTCWKIEIFDAFCGNIYFVYNYTPDLKIFTPLVLKEIVEKRLWKNGFKSRRFWAKKNLKNDVVFNCQILWVLMQ